MANWLTGELNFFDVELFGFFSIFIVVNGNFPCLHIYLNQAVPGNALSPTSGMPNLASI